MGFTAGVRGLKEKAISDWGLAAVTRTTTVDEGATLFGFEAARTVVLRDANVLLHQTVARGNAFVDVFDYVNGFRRGIHDRLRIADYVLISVDDPAWVPECKRETQAERDRDDAKKLAELRTRGGDPLPQTRLDELANGVYDEPFVTGLRSVVPLLDARPTRYRLVDEILRRLVEALRADAKSGVLAPGKVVVVDGLDPAGVRRSGARAPVVAGTDDELALLLARRGLAPDALVDFGDVDRAVRELSHDARPFPAFRAAVPIGEGDTKAPRLEEAVRCLGALDLAPEDLASEDPRARVRAWVPKLGMVRAFVNETPDSDQFAIGLLQRCAADTHPAFSGDAALTYFCIRQQGKKAAAALVSWTRANYGAMGAERIEEWQRQTQHQFGARQPDAGVLFFNVRSFHAAMLQRVLGDDWAQQGAERHLAVIRLLVTTLNLSGNDFVKGMPSAGYADVLVDAFVEEAKRMIRVHGPASLVEIAAWESPLHASSAFDLLRRVAAKAGETSLVRMSDETRTLIANIKEETLARAAWATTYWEHAAASGYADEASRARMHVQVYREDHELAEEREKALREGLIVRKSKKAKA